MKALGLEPLIHAAASVRSSQLGAYTEIGARTSVIESKLGDYSYVVNDLDVIYSTIGKFCSIASHVRINPGNHPMHRASQAHFTYRSSMYFPGESDEEEFFDWRRDHQVTIGHDVWIGHGAIVLPGRAVGAGAVVAGGAIVMKDVPEYRVVAGNPARPMRERFCPAISERLLSLAWWDWDHDRLCRALPDFRALSIEAFLEKYSAD